MPVALVSVSQTLFGCSSLMSLMLMEELRLGSGGGPMNLFLSVLTHSHLTLDLSIHQDVLSLVGNLLAGACHSALKQGQSDSGKDHLKTNCLVRPYRHLIYRPS